MKDDKKLSPEEWKKNDRLIDLVRQNCQGMTDRQVNLYLQHLKNVMKAEEEKNGKR